MLIYFFKTGPTNFCELSYEDINKSPAVLFHKISLNVFCLLIPVEEIVFTLEVLSVFSNELLTFIFILSVSFVEFSADFELIKLLLSKFLVESSRIFSLLLTLLLTKKFDIYFELFDVEKEFENVIKFDIFFVNDKVVILSLDLLINKLDFFAEDGRMPVI